MQKNVKISILCEIYGKLLTEKQYNALNDYYNNDLSLSEIGDNYSISRQGVRDLIKKGEEKLLEYEKAMEIMNKTQQNEKTIQLVISQLSEIREISSNKRVDELLNEIQKELHNIA
jgi:predicted DNA-binding protein YlxM (UPF0122 family)